MLDGNPATLWWLLAGGLVAAELLTGTVYLLMLAAGAALGALAAHAGAGATAQIGLAAAGGGAAVLAWHLWRRRHPPAVSPDADAALNLDIGRPVHVGHWRTDGTARVQHRGSAWDARWAGAGPAHPGHHVIRAVQGNLLVLDKAPQP